MILQHSGLQGRGHAAMLPARHLTACPQRLIGRSAPSTPVQQRGRQAQTQQQAQCQQQQQQRRDRIRPCVGYSPKGPELPDRIVASLPYLLPLLDTLPYGRFIFLQYPGVMRAMAPLGPLNALYHSFPFAPLIFFFAVWSGVAQNQSLSRFVRKNALQAVLLDILIIVPQVLLDAFNPTRGGGGDGLATQLYTTTSNTVFLFVAVSVAYGMGACAVGQIPRLPLVADAADSQMKDGPSGW